MQNGFFFAYYWALFLWLSHLGIKSFKLQTLYTRVSSSYYHSMTMIQCVVHRLGASCRHIMSALSAHFPEVVMISQLAGHLKGF